MSADLNQLLIDRLVGERTFVGTKQLAKAAVRRGVQSIKQEVGAYELAARRGIQCGVHEAYLAIRGDHADAAAAILKAFSMDEGGVISARGP